MRSPKAAALVPSLFHTILLVPVCVGFDAFVVVPVPSHRSDLGLPY